MLQKSKNKPAQRTNKLTTIPPHLADATYNRPLFLATMNLGSDYLPNSLPRVGGSREGEVGDKMKMRSSSPPLSGDDLDLKKATPKTQTGDLLKRKRGDVDESILKDELSAEATKKKRSKKKWKKPKGKPNRPLSAYNLFFQSQRATLLGDDVPTDEDERRKKRVHCKTHGKIGFAEMARTIGAMWRNLNPAEKKVFEDQAKEEKDRYAVELAKWKATQKDQEITEAEAEDTEKKPKAQKIKKSSKKTQKRLSNASQASSMADVPTIPPQQQAQAGGLSFESSMMMPRRLSELSGAMPQQQAPFQPQLALPIPGLPTAEQVQFMLAREQAQLNYMNIRALGEQRAFMAANLPNASSVMLPSQFQQGQPPVNAFTSNNPFFAAELERLVQSRRNSLLMNSNWQQQQPAQATMMLQQQQPTPLLPLQQQQQQPEQGQSESSSSSSNDE